MIFVNFKTYPQATGKASLKLALLLGKASKRSGIKIVSVVQAADVKEVSMSVENQVWTQHIDPVDFGAHTGAILAEAVKEDGAVGTFLNHSEKRFVSFDDLARARNRAKEVGLKTLIFAGDVKELEQVARLSPEYISYEPPELVGSTSASVASAHPDVIQKASEVSKRVGIPLIVGAGVHSNEDVRKSLELGAVGVAVATDIVKAEDPEEEINELIKGFGK